MISQTDALTKATEASGDSIDWMVNEQVVPLRDVHMMIRYIYESVGKCIDCKDNLYIDEELWCHTYQAPTNEDNFCSYFEKKQK